MMGQQLGQAIEEAKVQQGELWFIPQNGRIPPEMLGLLSHWESACLLQILEALRTLPPSQQQEWLDTALWTVRARQSTPPLHPEVEP